MECRKNELQVHLTFSPPFLNKQKGAYMPKQSDIQDPRKQYSAMDIPKQQQPEPGLDSKLKPQADHGADTYEGTDR